MVADFGKIRTYLSKLPESEWVSGIHLKHLWKLCKDDASAIHYVEKHLQEWIPEFKFIGASGSRYKIDYKKDLLPFNRMLKWFTYNVYDHMPWSTRLERLLIIHYLFELTRSSIFTSPDMNLAKVVSLISSWGPDFEDLELKSLDDFDIEYSCISSNFWEEIKLDPSELVFDIGEHLIGSYWLMREGDSNRHISYFFQYERGWFLLREFYDPWDKSRPLNGLMFGNHKKLLKMGF